MIEVLLWGFFVQRCTMGNWQGTFIESPVYGHKLKLIRSALFRLGFF